MLVRSRRIATANHKAAMRHGRMVARQLIGMNEMHRGVVFVKVMRHADDGLAHGLGIGAGLQHDKALALVLLPRRQLRAHAAAHLFNRRGHGNGVLHSTSNAGHMANGI